MKIQKKAALRILKVSLFTLAGAVLGFLYWKFVGCKTGTCPLTSHPVRSAVYGAVTGFIAGWI